MSVDAFADIVASSADDDEVLEKLQTPLQSNNGELTRRGRASDYPRRSHLARQSACR